MTDPDMPRTLGQWLTARQGELGGQWREYAKKIGISQQALRDIRNDKATPRPETKHKIDVAFRWKPGHGVDRIHAGAAPVKLEDVPAPEALPSDDVYAHEFRDDTEVQIWNFGEENNVPEGARWGRIVSRRQRIEVERARGSLPRTGR